MRRMCECWKVCTSFIWVPQQLVRSRLSPPRSSKHLAVDQFSTALFAVISTSRIFLFCLNRRNMENNRTFLYFAYGSNLLKERLQLKNPSATVHCVARLKVRSDDNQESVPCDFFTYIRTTTFSVFFFRTTNWYLGTTKALPVTGGTGGWPP